MAIYVDKAENPFGRMKMCHMLGDTVAELHDFAARIGLKPEWFQPRSRPHYDLSKTRRAAALAAGAIEVSRQELVAMIRRQAPTWQSEYAAAQRAAENIPNPEQSPMGVTEPQLHVLHLLMLGDGPSDGGWMQFSPPLNALVVRSCQDKGLIEVSHRGIRLTNAGRAAFVENQ